MLYKRTEKTSDSRRYTVTLRFQYPAWDEKDGINYEFIAYNKREANAKARKEAERDGHIGKNRGKYWFTAIEAR